MKIRAGFVSNSSGSSFILVYIPEDFDFDTYMEYLQDKYSKGKSRYALNEISRLTKIDFDNFIKKGRSHQSEIHSKFNELYSFLKEFSILSVDVQEDNGEVMLANKSFFNKTASIENKVKEINEKYKEQALIKKLKRDKIKELTKNIDPYGEEDWEKGWDDFGIKERKIYKVKKFKK